MSARLRAFARLGEGVFDLCVIGAGIVGSRVAYEAAKDGLRAVLFAFDALGGWSGPRSRVIDAAEARRLVPALKDRPLGATFIFDQAQVDDARLVLATALAAADAGAVVMNHARAVEITFSSDEARMTVRGPEGELALRAKSVVNATGAWIDEVRVLEDPKAEP